MAKNAVSEAIISVKDVRKTFRLPHENHSGIKDIILGIFRRNRKKGYEVQEVLKGVSFDIKKGEFFGIVGRNGSGKSTLLKLLSGIYEPDTGKIDVGGSLTPFIELGVGFNPELTGRENVFLNGALLGFSHIEVEAMYDDIVKFAELEKFMDQKLKNYSSGMQVRLAFSIAIRADTDILLLDEVLAVGDSNFQNKCFDFFNKIRHEKTIIFVSHDMGSVKRFCDRALLLEKGEIVEVGRAEDIAIKYGGIMAREEVSVTADTGNTKNGVHMGVGGASVTEITLHNQKDKSVKKVLPREPFSIKVRFSKDEDIDALGFLLTIFNNDGHKLFSTTSYTDNINTTAMRDKGEFTIKINDNIFAPGHYKVNVGIFNPTMSTPYDHFRDAFEFSIAGERKADSNISINYEWQ